MDEASQRRIGPYEISVPPHVGGIGEVYRAWDPRLKREVAVKVLHTATAGDPARRRQLLEEAQAAGGMNHPNIVAVYDVGEHDGLPFIVSEYIQGKELRDEINRGAIPTKRLLELAAQMAAGLRAAHDAGIVHRDLKPSNVMITRDGRAKIVDFGLAKPFALSPADKEAATVTLPGMVAGTPQYMSPEQARGGTVDFRTDQFSFGLMLYEMATGQHPFRRDSSPETMAAIIADEVRPLSELSPRTPTPLRWIIERCLAKEPEGRYASTTDLYRDLTTLQGRLGEITGEDNRPIAAPAKKSRMGLLVAGLALLVIAAGALLAFAPAEPSTPRYSPLVTDRSFQGTPAYSKDGKSLAYVSSVDGVLQLFTRSLETAAPLQVTRSMFDCSDPLWSPDNARIYYHSQALEFKGLWSVSAAGGPPQNVLENATSSSIAPDASTLAFLREGAESNSALGLRRSVWLASANGVDQRRYMEAPFDTRTFVDGILRFSPDGTKILAWVWGWADQKTGVPSLEFWVLPWPTGKPYQVLASLAREAPAAPAFDWFPDSRHIVVSLWDQVTTGMHLWKADIESGTSTPLTTTPGSENWPDVAPDGQRVAFASEAIDFDLIEIPLDGGPPKSLMATSRNELDPAFNRDGSQYAFVSDRGGALRIWARSSRDELFERAVVGPEQFPSGPTLALGALSFSPDGERIAYQRYGGGSAYQIWVSTLAAAGPPVLLASGLFYQDGPSWSPDGSSVAFIMRTRELTSALAIARVGAGGQVDSVVADVATLGLRPQWSPDGRWIVADTLEGVIIVSPDGKQRKTVSQESWIASTWAPDSRNIYVLKEADKLRHYALASVNIDTLLETVINPDLGPIPHASQPIRGLALTDRKSLATSVASARSDIWVVEGLTPPRTVFSRLLPWNWR